MKFNQFRLIIFISVVILLSSCLGTNTPVATSTDASFVSLTFAAEDSIPYLNTAVFTLVDKTITNVDSLPYKTRIDSVYPTFKFTTSAGAVLIGGNRHKKDSMQITGTDTIDFRKTLHIRNWASDGKAQAYYGITTNVHAVDPELYLWNQVPSSLSSTNATSQKTVILNNIMHYYFNDGTAAYSYTSSVNGLTWSSAPVTGLPVNTPLNDMMQFNGSLYLTQDGTNIYSSIDGLAWTKKTVTAFTFKSLAYVLNNELYAVVQFNDDASYRFAVSADGVTWNVTNPIPDNFPVRDFASVSYSSSTGLPKVLVLGGYSGTGAILKNNWSSEDGTYWIDFSTENHTLDTLAVGASVISYDSKLLVFGLRNDKLNTPFYKVSKDEGLSWQIPDTLRNFLPKDYPARSYQSVVVLNPMEVTGVQSPALKQQILDSNHIFIVGGKSGSTVYSDIWTGKLNRKSFLRQEPTIYVNK